MKASIDLSAVADQLAKCKPGDEYAVTFVVDTKTDNSLTGTASEIEHISDEEYEEATDERMTHGAAGGKRGVPKAIQMISK